MSKYLVETFYTCTFKIVHKLDELNEKKLSDLENRNDGKVDEEHYKPVVCILAAGTGSRLGSSF